MTEFAQLSPPPFEYEVELQDWLAEHPDALEPGLWIVGYEFPLGRNSVDLLGVDVGGRLVVIEVKRANATRDAVAQVLDYVSALELMDSAEIAGLIDRTSSLSEVPLVLDFKREYADRFGEGDLSMLRPASIILASTAAPPATERILSYLRDHNVDAKARRFRGDVENGKLTYRSHPSPRVATAGSPWESRSRAGRETASKPGHGTPGRGAIDDVHDGVEKYARANYAGAKLFTEVHATLVTALYEGTEEERALTGESFGIAVKMGATKSDEQDWEADYVTVRFYPHQPDHVRLSIFEAAWQRGGDEVEQLFNRPELGPEEGKSQRGRPLMLIWFDRETWGIHAELFKRFLRNAKAAWEAEREADAR